MTLTNRMTSIFPPPFAPTLPPPVTAPAPSPSSPPAAPNYTSHPDLMQQCTALTAEATYSEYKLFFHNFNLWYSIAFPTTAPCSRKQELFTRLDEQLKIEIAADFDFDKGTYLKLHKALDSRINILFPQKSRSSSSFPPKSRTKVKPSMSIFVEGTGQQKRLGYILANLAPKTLRFLFCKRG